MYNFSPHYVYTKSTPLTLPFPRSDGEDAADSRVLFLRSRGIERRRCICDILHLQCVRIVRTVRLVLVADGRVGDYLVTPRLVAVPAVSQVGHALLHRALVAVLARRVILPGGPVCLDGLQLLRASRTR